MKFTLEISCEGPAFEPELRRHHEIARMLRLAAQKVEEGTPAGHLRDEDGNRVGYFVEEPS